MSTGGYVLQITISLYVGLHQFYDVRNFYVLFALSLRYSPVLHHFCFTRILLAINHVRKSSVFSKTPDFYLLLVFKINHFVC